MPSQSRPAGFILHYVIAQFVTGRTCMLSRPRPFSLTPARQDHPDNAGKSTCNIGHNKAHTRPVLLHHQFNHTDRSHYIIAPQQAFLSRTGPYTTTIGRAWCRVPPTTHCQGSALMPEAKAHQGLVWILQPGSERRRRRRGSCERAPEPACVGRAWACQPTPKL